jgi:hypothetical protein
MAARRWVMAVVRKLREVDGEFEGSRLESSEAERARMEWRRKGCCFISLCNSSTW